MASCLDNRCLQSIDTLSCQHHHRPYTWAPTGRPEPTPFTSPTVTPDAPTTTLAMSHHKSLACASPTTLRASTHLVPETQRVGGEQGKAQPSRVSVDVLTYSLFCIFLLARFLHFIPLGPQILVFIIQHHRRAIHMCVCMYCTYRVVVLQALLTFCLEFWGYFL